MQEMLYPTSYLKSIKIDKAVRTGDRRPFLGRHLRACRSDTYRRKQPPEATSHLSATTIPILIDIPNRTIRIDLPDKRVATAAAKKLSASNPKDANRVVSKALKGLRQPMVTSADRGGVREIR